jgi:DNA-binding response OmpR family regulator/sugar lactone lactonase YvrE
MPKILIIDDEPGMRQVMAKILAPLGHEVIDADEGVRAVQMVKEISPDVVLLDIRLPDMDGPDIVNAIKQSNPNVPIVILSGFGDVDAAAELVKIGAFDYISKPFKVNELVDIVNEALNSANQAVSSASRGALKSSSIFKKPFAASAGAIPVLKKPKSNSQLLIIITASIVIAAAGIFTWINYFSAPKPAEFNIPYSNASGICFGNNYLWVSDWADESIYKHSLKDGLKIESAYKQIKTSPSGICFDGKNIWTTNSMEQKINKHRLDADLSIEASFKSPGPSPSGLCFDGKDIWSLDYQSAKLYRHRMDKDLSVAASYDIPAQNPCGLFAAGKYLYVADAKTNRVYKLSRDNLFLAGIYELHEYTETKKHIATIAYDGKSVWTCAGGIDKIYRCRLSDLKEVKF